MLTVKIIKQIQETNKTVYFSENDIELFKNVKDKIGKVQAVKVVRWAANCSLKDALDYINSL